MAENLSNILWHERFNVMQRWPASHLNYRWFMCVEWFQVTVNSPVGQGLLQQSLVFMWLFHKTHLNVVAGGPDFLHHLLHHRLSLSLVAVVYGAMFLGNFSLRVRRSERTDGGGERQKTQEGEFLRVPTRALPLCVRSRMVALAMIPPALFEQHFMLRCALLITSSMCPCVVWAGCVGVMWTTCWVWGRFPPKVKVQHLIWSVLTPCFIYGCCV